MARHFLWIALLFMSAFTRAQFIYFLNHDIPVADADGNVLTMPWAGGLNAAQYNTLDLNADGADDLVLYDRMANKVITLLRLDSGYRYAPEYEIFFPDGISNWLLLRDFNCDGKKDIFTGDVLGMKVYTNTSLPGENLSWEQFLFFSGSTKTPVLLTHGNVLTNLQLQYDDLPAIIDADGDGDLDIFNFRYAGSGVEFHQNLSMEDYGTCDSLKFKRITQSWGNFKECTCGVIALNGEDCPPPRSERIKHAGGKALLVLDTNGDQLLDFIFSEAECDQLYLLENRGTPLTPEIQAYSAFPSSHPVSIVTFPATYFEDVDFDGAKDLIASPNIYSKALLSGDLSRSNWLYKNTGTNANPEFTFVKDNFLQEHMIDVGDNAVPAFADYDGDADYDMFISTGSTSSSKSVIFLYENVGTAQAPSFQLKTDDYLQFSQSNFHNIKVQFVDMDGNGTSDLVFTATRFSSGTTALYVLYNKSKTALDFSSQLPLALAFNLNFNENLCVTDVNADGRPDILAGRGDGSLEYWKNVSTSSQAQFSLENEAFLGLGSSVLRSNTACAVADLDADGWDDLLLGDQSGTLKIISNYRNDAFGEAQTEIVFNPLLSGYIEQNLGGRIWPVAVNLFKPALPVIITGNVLGGVSMLHPDENMSSPGELAIDIFPNPLDQKRDVLTIKTNRSGWVQVFTIQGQQLTEPFWLQSYRINQYKLPATAAGLYWVRFAFKNKVITRLIILN